MKKVLVLLLVIAFLAISCAPQYVCPNGVTVDDPKSCGSVKEAPSGGEMVIAPEVQKILAKSSNVKSLSYNYKRVDLPLVKPLQFWTKGDAVKRELPVQTEVLNKNEMDVVIFNTVAKTANAYCESKKFCIKTGDRGAVEYDQYYVNTPLDWKEMIVSAKKVAEEQIADRKVWKLLANENITLWMDTFYGLPLRVDVGSERHEFQEPIFNSVEDDDVRFLEREN